MPNSRLSAQSRMFFSSTLRPSPTKSYCSGRLEAASARSGEYPERAGSTAGVWLGVAVAVGMGVGDGAGVAVAVAVGDCVGVKDGVWVAT